MFAMAFDDGGIMIWDTSNWNPIGAGASVINRPLYIVFSPDLTRLQAVTLPHIGKAEQTWTLEIATGNLLQNAALNPMGIRHTDNSDVPGFRRYRHYDGNRVDRTRVSPDGRLLASGFGSSIEVWNRSTRKLARVLQGHVAPVTLSFAFDSRHLISMSEGGGIRIWDVETGEPLFRLQGHNTAVQASLSADLRTLAVGFIDGRVVCYDLLTQQPILTLDGHHRMAQTVEFSYDGRYLATGAWSGERCIWESR